MKREFWIELAVASVLVVFGVFARIYFRDVPNFAPVAAMALFAGYYFRSWALAVAVPVATMGISDWFLGGYQAGLMMLVYAMLALPVALRGLLRRWLPIRRGKLTVSLAAVMGLLCSSLACSTLFFLATNFGWWATGTMYEHSLDGLLQCYARGLEFFRYTLQGDLCYAVLLFGGYAAAVNLGLAGERSGTTGECATGVSPVSS